METSNDRVGKTLDRPDEQPITARLAAAGSVRRELEDLLMAAPGDADQETYRALMIDQNVAGKRTEASRKKTWTNLKGRYLLDPDYLEFQAFHEAMDVASAGDDRGMICYLMMARTDRLFREMTLEHVVPALREPDSTIANEPIEQSISELGEAVGFSWTATTVEAVRKHFLSALKDFGLLRGSQKKRTNQLSPGTPVVIFAVQLGRLEGLTDRQILGCRWFQLLGMNQDAAIDRLYMAAQDGEIRFRKQAEVVELHLPEPGAP
jgi:hypothetical protein